MLFSTLLISGLSLLVSAQSGANPIIPLAGSISAGAPVTIKWQPNTQGTISLQLRWGAAQNLEQGTTIVSGIPNSGSYTWTPPKELKAGADYAIQITDSTGQTNYSPQFSIASTGNGLSATSTASTITSAASTSTITNTTTSASLITKSSTATKASSTTSTMETESNTRSTSSSASSTSKSAVPSSSVPKSGGGRERPGEMIAAVIAGAGLIVASF
ncbi:hypothetical protein EJ08DRAFT_680898 [Tothia fuscella]|uniref:Yeast cell wall synthesis Kre9/Knh1-like N-terminal domain-containing protein n=1 Tax=Tothia fuscella TaxID=1048955 RepID=A0A9P4TWS0_9PEZI|nr:hypothetical protein EJ08DRAFT_680898 [Tothia fuscella]